MKRFIICTMALMSGFCMNAQQWTPEQAQEWWDSQEWPVGCCYVPSYAINQFEMWQEDTFDIDTISKELKEAAWLGFNIVRVYLHEDLWHQDKDGFKSRIDEFLAIADRHGIKVTFTFCTNGGGKIPVTLGKQPEPEKGKAWHAWVQSPSTEVLHDPSRWGYFKEYLQDILRTYGNDSRILYWCLYNEPENIKKDRDPIDFLPSLYEWAWEVRPSQPLTSPLWMRPGFKTVKTKLDILAFICTNSDIETFHCYYPVKELKSYIKMLKRFRRPMICQEYLDRKNECFIEDFLPVLKKEKVGAINWGLVHGKANSRVETLGKSWFTSAEKEFIRTQTADKSTAGVKTED